MTAVIPFLCIKPACVQVCTHTDRLFTLSLPAECPP